MRHPRPWPRSLARRLLRTALLTGSLLAGTAILLPGARPALAAQDRSEGAVRLTDGRVLEGKIEEREREVVVTSSGIATTVSRTQIAGIEFGTPEQRLKRRLEALPADDAPGRLNIADEALRRGLLDLAEDIAGDVLRRDPNNARASALQQQVSRQRELRRVAGTGRRSTPPGQGATTRHQNVSPRNLLNEDQVNRVRQVELQQADIDARRDRPRASFQNDVVRRYAEQNSLDLRDFNRLDDLTKAWTILREGPEDLWPDVRINSDPIAMLQYVRAVEPVLLNGCATSGCHGAPGVGGFVLHPRRDDQPTSQTNFYILSTHAVEIAAEPGAFGETAVARRLVDRDRPDESILLEYMLPYDVARNPHPRVDDYAGLVRGTNDENYRNVRSWIAEALPRITGPGYGFEFHPEGAQTRPTAATRPTTRPGAGNRRTR